MWSVSEEWQWAIMQKIDRKLPPGILLNGAKKCFVLVTKTVWPFGHLSCIDFFHYSKQWIDVSWYAIVYTHEVFPYFCAEVFQALDPQTVCWVKDTAAFCQLSSTRTLPISLVVFCCFFNHHIFSVHLCSFAVDKHDVEIVSQLRVCCQIFSIFYIFCIYSNYDVAYIMMLKPIYR